MLIKKIKNQITADQKNYKTKTLVILAICKKAMLKSNKHIRV